MSTLSESHVVREKAGQPTGGRFPDVLDLLASSPIVEDNPADGTGTVFENRYVTVATVPSRFGPFTVVQSGTGSGAAVLAVRDDRILLVRQPRYATGHHQWELPRGGAAPGEDLAKTARRETVEETGQAVESQQLWSLGAIDPDSGLLNTRVGLFLAELPDTRAGTDTAPGNSQEVDQVAWVPKETLVQACADGTITDSFTCVAVLRARIRGLI